MAELRTIQNSFNAGEISPLVAGRIDQAKYFNSLHACENWIPMVQGGLRWRGGFKYAGAVKTSTTYTRLIPFVFSATVAYVLEVGNLYIRVWTYDATGEPDQVDITGTPIEVTSTYATADLDDLHFHQTGDTMYIVHQTYAPAKLERVSATSFRLTTMAFNVPPTYEGKTDLTTTMYSSHATGSGRTLTTGGPGDSTHAVYAADRARYVATNDGGLALITAVPSSTTLTVDILEGSFKLVAAPYASGEWWLTGSPTSVTTYGLPVTLGGTGSIDSKDSVGGAAMDAFRATDIAKYVHALGGSIKIDTVAVSTGASGPVKSILSDGLSTPVNAVGGTWTLEQLVWTAAAYPNRITIGEQRVWYGGSANESDTVRGTVTGDYQNFAPGVNDDLACLYIISSDEVSVMQWLHWWKGLIVGCVGKVIVLTSPAGGMTPTDLPEVREFATGAAAIQPFRAGNSLLFVEYGGRRVMAFDYNYLADNYDVADLNNWADHLTWTYTFEAMAWQNVPERIGWFLRTDGTLCACTFDKNEKVVAWSRHSTSTAAGVSDIESICVVPNAVKARDELWIQVARSINGSTARYIEVLDPDKYLDCSYTYSGGAVSEITVAHLAAESAYTRSSTRIYPAQTVTGNKVTGLSPTVTAAEVGLLATATATLSRIEVPGAPTIQGRAKTIGPVTVRCLSLPVISINGVKYKAKGLVAGYSAASVYVIPTTDAISSSTADGDLEVPATGYDTDGRISLVQNLPLGGKITMVTAQVAVGG